MFFTKIGVRRPSTQAKSVNFAGFIFSKIYSEQELKLFILV